MTTVFTNKQIQSALNLQGFQPESAEVVVALETRIGVTFPVSLKRIWSFGEESAIYFDGFAERPYCAELCSLRARHTEFCSSTIEECLELICEEFPGVVPIGKEGDGGMLVLDYRRSPDPVVLKYDLDIVYRSSQPFYFMARNVDEMIMRGQADYIDHFRASDTHLSEEEVADILGFCAADTFAHRRATSDRPDNYFIR